MKQKITKIIKMLKDSFVLHIGSVSVKRLSVKRQHNLKSVFNSVVYQAK